MTSLIQYPCNIDYLQCISSRDAILPPKITDLCNINTKQKPDEGGFRLESISEGFQKLIGAKWDQDGNYDI